MAEKKREYTLSSFLSWAAENYPDRDAVLFDEQRISYKELDEKASRFAAGLLKIGVKPGERVGLWMPNYPQWMVAYFGIARMGAVVVPMNTRYRAKELEYIINNSEATTLVLVDKFLKTDYERILEETWEKMPTLKRAVSLGESRESGCGRIYNFEELLQLGADYSSYTPFREAVENLKEDEVTFILYTSGTTGEPKGAMLTNLNITKNAEQIAEVQKQTPEDVMLIVVPFFHCFGCVIGITAAVSSASAMVPVPVFNAEEVMRLVERHRVTILHGVPTMFIEWLEVLKKKPYDVSSLRTGVMAGAPCPIEVMRGSMERMGMNTVIAYGLTEASPVITMTRFEDSLEDRVETVGRPLPDIEVRIVDDNHNPLPPGEVGELACRGYNVMKGYFKKPKETAETIDEEGWLYSGDLAVMDERGYVRIVGRKKEMYITGGFNVYPREIEEFLFTHPKVENVAVIGVPDKKFGEVGMAVIKLKEGETATEEEIIEYCKGKIANYKIPRYVVFVDSYPMTQSGKIQKYKLREWAEGLLKKEGKI
ncbi:MAG: long-chain-fatty-acid--CoA ligase [Thermoplasmata archaeon]|nr:long-chain-fatty-acid--CoA ligase [Thermoplasmata archaeon]